MDTATAYIETFGRALETLTEDGYEHGRHPGDCQYKEGNLRAFCRAELLERMLPQLGVDPRRFSFDYVSAAEAEKFSRITTEFVERVRSLG